MKNLSVFIIGLVATLALTSCKPIVDDSEKMSSLASDVHEILIETPKVSLASKQMKDSEACEAVKCIFLQSYVTSDNYGSTGKIKALIPANGLDDFLTKVTANQSEVKKHSISQSISAVKADFAERLKIKKTIYEKLLASAQDGKTESVNAILATENELSRLQEEIETTNAIITANQQVKDVKEENKEGFLDVIIAQADKPADDKAVAEDKKDENKPTDKDKVKDTKKAPMPKAKKYSALSPLVLVDIDYRTPTLLGSFDVAPIERAWGQAKDIASGSIADAIIFGSYALPWLPLAIILAWLISIALRKKKSRRRVKAYRYQAPTTNEPKLSKKEAKRLKKEEASRLKEEARQKQELEKQRLAEEKQRLKEEAKQAKKDKKTPKAKEEPIVDEPSLFVPQMHKRNTTTDDTFEANDLASNVATKEEIKIEDATANPIIEETFEPTPSTNTEDSEEDYIAPIAKTSNDDDEENIDDIYVTKSFFGKIKKPTLGGSTPHSDTNSVIPVALKPEAIPPQKEEHTAPIDSYETKEQTSEAQNSPIAITSTPSSKGILGSSVLSGLSLNQSTERETATQDAAQEWEDVVEESHLDLSAPEEISASNNGANIEYEEVEYEYSEESADEQPEYEYVEAEEGVEYAEEVEYEYVEGEDFEEILDETDILEEDTNKNS